MSNINPTSVDIGAGAGSAADREMRTGVLAALGCYGLWGVVPVYYKFVTTVPAMEVLLHRVVWASVFLALMIAVRKRWSEVWGVFRRPKLLGTLVVTSILVSANWFLFIWAVMNDRILETSLGYYLNPLVSIFLGMIFLTERLRRGQLLALILASSGVLMQVLLFGYLPWVALVLAFSFAGYGLLRKQTPVDSVLGLFIETLILFPVALLYGWWLWQQGALQFGAQGIDMDLLLIFGGMVTIVPLLLFTTAARRLSLTMIGFLQYIAPSITFLLAVLVYDEPVSDGKVYTFVLIWAALLVFTIEGVRNHRLKQKPALASRS